MAVKGAESFMLLTIEGNFAAGVKALNGNDAGMQAESNLKSRTDVEDVFQLEGIASSGCGPGVPGSAAC